MLNVFHRDRDAIRHFCRPHLFFEQTEPPEYARHRAKLAQRKILLVLTPEGRDRPTGTSS